jgi:hypothetical protein
VESAPDSPCSRRSRGIRLLVRTGTFAVVGSVMLEGTRLTSNPAPRAVDPVLPLERSPDYVRERGPSRMP